MTMNETAGIQCLIVPICGCIDNLSVPPDDWSLLDRSPLRMCILHGTREYSCYCCVVCELVQNSHARWISIWRAIVGTGRRQLRLDELNELFAADQVVADWQEGGNTRKITRGSKTSVDSKTRDVFQHDLRSPGQVVRRISNNRVTASLRTLMASV